MRLYYTLFEPCDINLFMMRSCSVHAQVCVPLAGCCAVTELLYTDKSWCCRSKGGCVPLHSLWQLQGRLLALFLSFPFLYLLLYPFGPWFPTWPSSGNRSCGRKMSWGLIGVGEGSPQGCCGSLSGGVGCYQFCPVVLCSPEQQPVPGSLFHPLARCDEWEGRLAPFFFSPQSIWGKSTSGYFTDRRPTVSLVLGHL